jgi:hypothetical protein
MMKIASACYLCLLSSTSAFTVQPFARVHAAASMPSRTTLFASVEDETSTKKNVISEDETMEEEVERMVAEAREKASRMAKMKSASGQSYAPW